jgi:large subunit ribosomal protein L32
MYCAGIKVNRGVYPQQYRVLDMAVQQNKVSKSRRNNRRAHDALKAGNPNECPNCGELKRPHHICSSCGFYGDKEVIPMTEEIELDDDAA